MHLRSYLILSQTWVQFAQNCLSDGHQILGRISSPTIRSFKWRCQKLNVGPSAFKGCAQLLICIVVFFSGALDSVSSFPGF